MMNLLPRDDTHQSLTNIRVQIWVLNVCNIHETAQWSIIRWQHKHRHAEREGTIWHLAYRVPSLISASAIHHKRTKFWVQWKPLARTLTKLYNGSQPTMSTYSKGPWYDTAQLIINHDWWNATEDGSKQTINSSWYVLMVSGTGNQGEAVNVQTDTQQAHDADATSCIDIASCALWHIAMATNSVRGSFSLKQVSFLAGENFLGQIYFHDSL